MDIVEKLIQAQKQYCSNIGASNPGVGVEFRGHNVFEKFKHSNWLGMFYFSVTGRELSENAKLFLNGIYSMGFSYPDVRIWNNGVAALAASTRSTAQLGVTAACAVSEARFYGGRPVMKSIDFLMRAKKLFDAGVKIDEIIKQEVVRNKYLFGYGRPVVSKDERVAPTIDLLKELNLFDRPNVQFAIKIDQYLKHNNKNFRMNVCGLFAAFCADEEISSHDAYYMLVVCYSVGMVACYVDVLGKPEGQFLPFQCKSINYKGKEERNW